MLPPKPPNFWSKGKPYQPNSLDLTIRSSEETTADKQTGERTRRDTTQGLASRPGVMYAAEGVDKMEIDRPMVVGEKDVWK